MSFAIFNESFYLENYADVREAVASGLFSSGLQHFQQFGVVEGRTLISPSFDEATYLARNADVAEAVRVGLFRSGLQHFIVFGEAEGRSGTPAAGPDPVNFFNEKAYLTNNLDVSEAVRLGKLKSGLEHYQKFGQFEGRTGYFNASSASDVITAFGSKTQIYGVAISSVVGDINSATYDVRITSKGDGEIDTLVGSSGSDQFVVGVGRTTSSTATNSYQSFYLNSKDIGTNDYALIRNFEKGKDTIVLGGTPNQFTLVPNGFGGDYLIYTASNSNLGKQNDLVAVIEGNPDLALLNPSDAVKSGFTLLG
ncbi:hypothetical protein H6S82_03105 [Planktothrix sp. FACHB-1355]|uniref:Calcium-binding protein n=1 Tax=Aerosakkonema funiforme FACHB-1375 TaxID=2949571 RepID=A0A926VIW3_9CYAN|nr:MULTISPECIES: hypothetical protein [Oscillatoriales]MBD2184008.1 hypothetical protein [Aerosakkonema funiforme FACHB-1375]MBD3557845.1 hypothetical protein [Planktothrix sp. FACHB-1355]